MFAEFGVLNNTGALIASLIANHYLEVQILWKTCYIVLIMNIKPHQFNLLFHAGSLWQNKHVEAAVIVTMTLEKQNTTLMYILKRKTLINVNLLINKEAISTITRGRLETIMLRAV